MSDFSFFRNTRVFYTYKRSLYGRPCIFNQSYRAVYLKLSFQYLYTVHWQHRVPLTAYTDCLIALERLELVLTKL
jgi:hypothetical protein